MKKVLLITKTPCYPLHSGGALAQYYFIDGLKDSVQFVLCTEAVNQKEVDDLEELKKIQPSLKVYYSRSFSMHASLTFKQKVRSRISKMLFKKPVLTADINTDDFRDDYFEHVDHVPNRAFVELINEVIDKEKIDLLQFDFYDTIDLCFAVPQKIRKIFICHEVRFKRLKLAFETSKQPAEYKNYLIDKTELFERNCIRQMDEVVVFNEDDAKLLKDDCRSITVSPFGIPDEVIFTNDFSNQYKRLLFVGGESHTPNKLGLMWFLDEIFIPNISETQLPLYVVGSWSEEVVNRYIAYSNIVFTGKVVSVESWFEASILVNPIKTGAGIRTKILQAFANKVPVLSTHFGAEGCFTENNKEHLALFENGNDFIKLLKTTDFKRIASAGYEYYNQEFNKEKLLSIRKNIVLR